MTARLRDHLGLLLRLVLGVVPLLAGGLKVGNPLGAARAVQAYEVLPFELARWVGYALPWVEIVVGLLLVLGLFTRVSAVLGAVLMLAFVIGIGQAWARGLTIDCGCFGGGGQVSADETRYGREIARDLFDDPEAVDFRFVESSNRVDALNSGAVDMIVRTMTISPEREREVAFSIPYMRTQTRMLVLSKSGIKSIKDTAGKTLCGVGESTALDTIREHAPKSDILVTRSWGDCLMALQLNQADGIVVDDALLSGMAAQDSYTSIVGEPLETENYGVAVRLPSKQHDTRPLLRQVNSTLERIRRDGTWSSIFEEWLGAYLEEPTLPAGKYIEEDAKP